MNISKQLAGSLVVLQKYALAPDKQEFLESLPSGFEKRLLTILKKPYDDKTSQELNKLNIPRALISYIEHYKTNSSVEKAQKVEDIKFLVDKLKNSFVFPNKQNQGIFEQNIIFENIQEEKKKSNKISTQKDFITFAKSKIDHIRKNQPKVGRQQNILSQFTNYALVKLFREDNDFKNIVLDCMPISQKEYFINNRTQFLAEVLEQQDSVEFLCDFYRIYTSRHDPTYQFNANIFQYLTTSQINSLGQKLPNMFLHEKYCLFWFKSNYTQRLPILTTNNELLNALQKKQKKRLLLQIIEDINSVSDPLPYTLRSIQIQCLNKLLFLERDSYDPSPKTLLTYLTKYPEILNFHNQEYRKILNSKKHQANSSFTPQNIGGADFATITNTNNVGQLMLEHLGLLFQNQNDEFKGEGEGLQIDHNQFLKFIDYNVYFSLKAKTLLKKGKPLNGIYENILSKNELQTLKKQRSLKIHPINNCKFLGVKDSLQLKLQIKNIDSFLVKIYEVDLQKYYIQKQQQVNNQINIQSLTPFQTFEREIKINSQYEVMNYNLPITLKEDRGLFIIEIQGKGQSSRAIIRKGGIIPTKKYTLAGVQVTFYYENSNRVPQGSFLWIDKRKHMIKDGKCTIPYGKTTQSYKAVAFSEGFAHLFDITIPEQNYSLDMLYLYNSQSFIVGNKAKVVIHPRLKLVTDQGAIQQMVSLKLLKNVNIEVVIEDNLGIKSSLNFKDIKLDEKSDYIVQIPIQTYTRSILIYGSSQIEKYNGQKQHLQFVEKISISLAQNLSNIAGVYLRKAKNDNKDEQPEYKVNIFGLSGQPLDNVRTKIQVFYEECNYSEIFDASTDQKGEIKLGKLQMVRKIRVSPESGIQKNFDAKEWELGSTSTIDPQLHQRLFTFKQGQIAQIPLPQYYCSRLKNNQDLKLFKFLGKIRLEQCTNKIKENNKLIKIEGLSEGNYELKLIKQRIKISILVIKGKQFEKANQVYVEDKQKLYEIIRNSCEYFRLGQAKVTENQQFNQVQIEVIKPEGIAIPQKIKAHILISNFIPQNLSINQFDIKKDIRIHKFNRPGNTYFSNKQLSEQSAYVMNRRNEKQFIGNNFEKPHMLLKRTKIRDTNEVDQSMNQGGAYQKVQYNNQRGETQMDIEQKRFDRSLDTVKFNRNRFTVHNNFLALSGKCVTNLKQQNCIKLKLSKGYSFIQVFLVSSSSFIHQSYHIDSEFIKTKSIAHLGLPEEEQNKAISISREIYPLWQTGNNKLEINRNSKWSAISLNNIKTFVETKGIKLGEWIDKWQSMSKQKKLQMYNNKMCHQLNCFIKHQDNKFFNQIVAPYIRNKANKTLVDLCLLEDQKCLQWSKIDIFQSINVFEKILLIEYCARQGDFKKAKILANRIILQEKPKKISFNQYKQQFDTMLNSDASKNNQSNNLFGIQQNIQIQSAQYQDEDMFMFGNSNQNYSMNNNSGFSSNSFGMQQQCMTNAMPMQMQQQMMPPNLQNAVQMQQVLPMQQAMPMQQQRHLARSRPPASSLNRSPPPPPPPGLAMNSSSYMKNDNMFDNDLLDYDESSQIEMRDNYKKQFKQIEKTKQYDEVTYEGIKSSSEETKNLLYSSKFWAQLATHLTNPDTINKFFVSQSILYLNTKIEFQLACCFIPNHLNPDYQMNVSESKLEIQAKNSFLIFLKEIKQMEYAPKFGIMLNHRFYDPQDQYIYTEDGFQQQKCIQNDQFKPLKAYFIQTIITNTSGNTFELQILLDIPEGAVPLQTNQYTQITNLTISSYSTHSFTRKFYFPYEGEYRFYPSNVSWGRKVISKAKPFGNLKVSKKQKQIKINSFSDVLNTGKQSDVIEYIKQKNIFDHQLFDYSKILWMFGDKNFYEKVLEIFREKMYFEPQIWKYSFMHADLVGIKQYFRYSSKNLPNKSNFKLLQYYPYYSSRAHRYLDQTKSKIRNLQLKQTYYKFLFDSIMTQNNGSTFKLASIYYLLLQDRITQASEILKRVSIEQRKDHQLQFDHFECFLDMYQGYPSFTKSRKIVQKYKDYPIKEWNNNMKQIYETLKQYDSAPVFEEQTIKIEYNTQIYRQGEQIRINIPTQTKIEVMIFPIDVELHFSETPFRTNNSFISIKPFKTIVFEAGKSRQETIKYKDEFKNVLVEIYETKNRNIPKKINSFQWTNPKLKIKLTQNKGLLQVFYEGKQVPGSYCKVYSKGRKGNKFYRDGYTDITGTFKYALTDLDQIQKFSILCLNDHGGIINEVSPPKENGFFEL